MKHLIILAFMGVTLAATAQQSSQPFEYRPSFSAIVVSNIDASAEWYKKVFGLTTGKQLIENNLGVRLVVLESEKFSIELLEFRGSLARKDLLQGKPEHTEIQGHFKIGFNVPDMDACLKYLASLQIIVPQVWTDSKTKKKNFIISDPDGNRIQFFE